MLLLNDSKIFYFKFNLQDKRFIVIRILFFFNFLMKNILLKKNGINQKNQKKTKGEKLGENLF